VSTAKNHFGYIKGWVGGPTAIMEWCAAVIVGNLEVGAMIDEKKKLERLRVTATADHVNQRFAIVVAWLRRNTSTEQGLDLIVVAGFHGVNKVDTVTCVLQRRGLVIIRTLQSLEATSRVSLKTNLGIHTISLRRQVWD